MASISSLAAAYLRPSPRDLLQQQLASEVASGKVKEADKAALASALDSIDSSLQAQRSAPPQNSAPAERGRGKSLREAVSNLIQQQVDSGSLTADQGAELKQVIADTFAKGGAANKANDGGSEESKGAEGAKRAGGHKGGHHGGPKGAGGPPSPPKNDASSTASSGETTDPVADLLKKLQAVIDSASTYSAAGSSKNTTTSKALLIDFSA